uniref:Uncharacterized protein n=1 Tax=Rhizophora mucronata TaxID=61149 RepID=A0A2P2PFY5_RHIMU
MVIRSYIFFKSINGDWIIHFLYINKNYVNHTSIFFGYYPSIFFEEKYAFRC